MKIAYYTYDWFLDHSLSLARVMSRDAEVHLFVEVSPDTRLSNWFGEPAVQKPGVHSARVSRNQGYLAGAAPFLSDLASFELVVHTSRRAVASLNALRTSLAVATRLERLRPDVLHFEHVWTRSAPLFFLTPGIPKVLSIHDSRLKAGEKVDRTYKVRRLVAGRARRLLFYSQYSARLYAQEAQQRGYPVRPYSVVPLGVKEIFREWPGQDVLERPATLLFFGRLTAYKGLEVLYKALPRVAMEVPRLRVVIAGEPVWGYQAPPAPSLPGDTELVTYFKKIDVPTVRRLFQEASIVVVPYTDASQSGVVQLAYAFGKPVIASAVGGLPEAVCHGVTGRLVPPGDPDALASAAIELLTDHALRSRMRQGVHRLEETTFGWQPLAPQLRRVYEAAITAMPAESPE